jgi:hypothetical protein
MRDRDFSNLLTFGKGRTERSPECSKAPRCQLKVEHLEERMVPAMVDLTSYGDTANLGQAIVQQSDPQPTGCGVIHDFVRIQSQGSQQTVEQGYNTDARPLQFDEQSSPIFTRSLQLSELPTVTIGNVVYREILLGANQKSSQPFLSLDELRLYAGTSPNLTGYDPTAAVPTLGGLSPIYDMGAGNWVKIDTRLSHGNGSGDVFLFVPDSLFTGAGAGSNPYVYLYSKFGVNFASNGGFEQWAPAVTVPSSGMISGTVTCDGALEANAIITIQVDGIQVSTLTDGSGNYAFNDLAVGLGSLSTYIITATDVDGGQIAPNTPTSYTVTLTLANPIAANQNFTFINCNPVELS